MGVDFKTVTQSITSTGAISTDNGKFSTDGVSGNVTAGNMTYGAIAGQGKATAQAMATGGTIALTANCVLLPITLAAAATGVILAAGSVDGQQVKIENKSSANSCTFAAAATSNVALGASAVIAALGSLILTWDNTALLWY